VANQKTYIDFVSAFESGCQTGVSPLLVKKNQLANALNVSLRGGFLTHRPPYQKKTLNFQGSTTTAALMSGLFQGAGYYRPDFGTESLLAQISGHLLQFTEQGEDWNVIDVSIPNDLNAATTSQVWMNQAEKWEIINDGSGVLPIFFDGTTSRRSYGDSIVLGTTAAAFTPPGVGSSVELTLQSPFTGQYNVPFLLNGAYYQAITGAVGQYAAILTNLDDSPSTVWPELTQITYNPQNIGYSVQPYALKNVGGGANGTAYRIINNIPLAVPYTGAIGATVFWGVISASAWSPDVGLPVSWSVVGTGQPGSNSLYPNNPTIDLSCIMNTFHGQSVYLFDINISSTQLISFASSTLPQVVLGLTTAAFTAPNNGADVQVGLTVPYTGQDGALVSIGVDNYGNPIFYLISAVPQTPVSNQLLVLDLADATTNPVAGGEELLSVPELPAGRMGAYGMGRQWMCLTDGISYMAGDAVGDPSGTKVLNYRDAVLKVTENDFQTNGGTFILPGSGDIITAMIFQPVLDTSLGQGALIISTPFSMWSNNAPIDRSTWANLTNPIVTETLKDNAAVGQDNTILVNSDTFFRSDVAIGSLVLARRSFMGWGNKPVSNEVRKYLEDDDQTLLSFGSAVSFDNRYLCTCAPYSQAGGVIHSGLVALNFDLMTSLRETLPPAWEGLWTGINVLKLVSGRVNGTKRNFAFTYNITTSTIELYELLAEYSESYLDNDETPIFWAFETPALFNQDIKPLTTLCQLGDGEFYISNIKGTVTIKVWYRPDFYPIWTLWQTQTVCADTDNTNQQTGYRMRLGLGEPDVEPSEIGNDRSLTVGNFFQCRVEITGSCEWNGMQVSAVEMPQPAFAPVDIPPDCQNIQGQVPDDFTLYGLQGFPPQIGSGSTAAPAPFPFFNEVVYFNLETTCVTGFSGTLPSWITIDGANYRLVGAAGVIGGTTQAEANANAQLALNQFGEINIINGNFYCSNMVSPGAVWPVFGQTITINGFVIGQQYVYVLGNSSQLIAFDGKYMYAGIFVAQYTHYGLQTNNLALTGQLVTAQIAPTA
jgi:hypothetical protein